MPFLLAEILNFQGSTPLIGVGSFSEIYISEATAVCGCVGFYSRADRSASYPDCNGTYEEQKTEKYVGRTDGGKTAFG